MQEMREAEAAAREGDLMGRPGAKAGAECRAMLAVRGGEAAAGVMAEERALHGVVAGQAGALHSKMAMDSITMVTMVCRPPLPGQSRQTSVNPRLCPDAQKMLHT